MYSITVMFLFLQCTLRDKGYHGFIMSVSNVYIGQLLLHAYSFIYSFIHSFIYSFKTKSVSWFAAGSLFICGLLVLYVIWYNLYILVCVFVCVCVIFLFCMLFIYLYIFSIWRNKSWNQIPSHYCIFLLTKINILP